MIFLKAQFKKGPLPVLKSLPDENVLTNRIRGSEGAGGQESALLSFRALPPKAIRTRSIVNAAVMAVRFNMNGPAPTRLIAGFACGYAALWGSLSRLQPA